jgi:serine/threonine protein kinase
MVAERYRVVGLLGRGGMGEVYRAEDLTLNQQVALKFLPEVFAKDPDRLARFLQEVRNARQVTHPNVCRVYDIGQVAPSASSGQAPSASSGPAPALSPSKGQHFISMEYVDGEDLSVLLRRIGRLPGDKAVQIARQLCAGLAAAHEQGILHRDLKPANVMLDGQGRVRITDFGLSGLAEGFTGEEVRAGTPAYQAPEQLAGTGVSVLSDIYALGLVMYELFSGKPAYRAANVSELRDMQQATPMSLSSVVSDMDDAVERVILPDSTILCDYMLARLTRILDGLQVYPERMQRNMALTHGLVFSQAVLLALTSAGMTRDSAYLVVQRNAMRSWADESDFRALLQADSEVTEVLAPDALDACFDATRYLENVDAIFERVFG